MPTLLKIARFAFWMLTGLYWSAVLMALLSTIIAQTDPGFGDEMLMITMAGLMAVAIGGGFFFGHWLVHRHPKAWTCMIGASLLLVVLAYVGMYGYGRWTYHRQWQAWLNTGRAAQIEDLLPDVVPLDQDAYQFYGLVFADLRSMSEAERELVNEAAHREGDAAAMAPLLDEHSGALRRLHAGSERPMVSWPTNYSDPTAIMPHLGDSRRAATLLAAEARHYLAQDNVPEAERSLRAILRLSDHLSQEPFVLSHLVGISVAALALQGLEEGFAERDDVPPLLLDDLRAFEPRAYARRVSEGDALWCLLVLELDDQHLFSSLQQMRRGEGHPWGWMPGNRHRLAAMSLYANRLAEAEIGKPRYMQNWSVLDAYVDNLPAWASDVWVGTTGSYNDAIARLEVRLIHAELAIRLRQHKGEHGAYPDDLAALGEVPVDPWDGQAVDYARMAEGFVLRSQATTREGPLEWHWLR